VKVWFICSCGGNAKWEVLWNRYIPQLSAHNMKEEWLFEMKLLFFSCNSEITLTLTLMLWSVDLHIILSVIVIIKDSETCYIIPEIWTVISVQCSLIACDCWCLVHLQHKFSQSFTVALQLKANDGAEKHAGFSHMLLCFVFNLYFSFLSMQVHPSPISLLSASWFGCVSFREVVQSFLVLSTCLLFSEVFSHKAC
jgi:hypothetical protein